MQKLLVMCMFCGRRIGSLIVMYMIACGVAFINIPHCIFVCEYEHIIVYEIARTSSVSLMINGDSVKQEEV
jgi:hypothetical protein